MKRIPLVVSAIALAASGAGAAGAATISDPVGDFLSTYTAGPLSPDLDVTSFSVNYNSSAQLFTLSGTLAGAINPAVAGLYVIGVDTGTGVNQPFGNIGEPAVVFNQAIAIQKAGTGTIGQTVLDPATITIAGATFTVSVPLALLPSTGFAPEDYGFNLWPRSALGNNNQISDFAPQNANLTATGRLFSVPEPASWAMMIAGLGAIGVSFRRRRRALA